MKKILFILFILSTFICKSQYFSADRPGVGYDVSVIPENRFQIETGCYFYNEISYNNSMIRYSFYRNIEFRLSSNYVKSSGIVGFKPFTLGLKVKIFDNKSLFPAMSFISQLQLPILAKSEFKTEILPSYYILLKNKISNKISIVYNIGIETHEISFDELYNIKYTLMYSLSVGFDIYNDYGVFIEIYNNYSDNTSFDFGFTKTIRGRLQFDTSYMYYSKSLNLGFVYLL